MTLVPTNKSKEITTKYEELWSNIKDQISAITNNSDDYDEKYTKITFNSNDNFPLNKTLGPYNRRTIIVRAVMKITNITCKFF